MRAIAKSPAPIRMAVFIGLLLSVWLPWVGLVYWQVQDPNTISLLTMPVVFIEFCVLLHWWGRKVYHLSYPFQFYGLGWTQLHRRELALGLSLGLFSLLGLFFTEYLWGWLSWQPTPQFLLVIPVGLAIALGVGFAEELIFRGWLLDEFQRDYSLNRSLWLSSFAFACLHYIRPLASIVQTLPQFLGLVLLGLTLVWAKRSSNDRLSLPIGLHAGLIWGFYLLNVGGVIQYAPQVPEWLTGIDGNPLAGVMGLICLGAIALLIRSSARQVTR